MQANSIWQGRWFDQLTSKPTLVQVTIAHDQLQIHLLDTEDRFKREYFFLSPDQFKVREHFSNLPIVLDIVGKGSLHIHDDQQEGFKKALAHLGHSLPWSARLIKHWHSIAVCLIALFLLFFWIDKQGADLAAQTALYVIPNSIDQKTGSSTLKLLESEWLVPSHLSKVRQEALRQHFTEIMHKYYPHAQWQLIFRTTKNSENNVNALSLPDGTIILLDGLAEKLNDEQVLAVLGHELGHLIYRHSMRAILRSAIFITLSNVLWGDISSLAATFASGIQGLKHSRTDELEADQVALVFLRRAGLSEQRLAEVFQILEHNVQDHASPPAFLNTHPTTEERIDAIKTSKDKNT